MTLEMMLERLLSLSDAAIAKLYNKWSQDNYCAVWVTGGEYIV